MNYNLNMKEKEKKMKEAEILIFPTKRGSRYIDLKGVINVIIYSGKDMIKLMPIAENSMIDVWDKDEFHIQVSLLRFVNIPHPPITRENVAEHLLEYQLNILGKTMSDTDKDEGWKSNWRMTKKQKEMFKSYSVGILKKVFRFNTSKALSTYEFFNKEFGLSEV